MNNAILTARGFEKFPSPRLKTFHPLASETSKKGGFSSFGFFFSANSINLEIFLLSSNLEAKEIAQFPEKKFQSENEERKYVKFTLFQHYLFIQFISENIFPYKLIPNRNKFQTMYDVNPHGNH
jgi:hypothetical protein